MAIDWKYKIQAVNPCSKNTHDENDSILFLAKDKAVPALLMVAQECIALTTTNAPHEDTPPASGGGGLDAVVGRHEGELA